MEKRYDMNDLRNVMKQLLGEKGCPWDKAQNHESLRQYFIEEVYEVVDAINKKDSENLCEELGDVLFQIVFHSELAEKEELFKFEDVVHNITKKMINRHPHIFSDAAISSTEDINKKWESIKKEEKGYKSNIEIVKSVPASLPALMRAEKTVSKAEKTKLDTLNYNELIEEGEELYKLLKSENIVQKKDNLELIGKILMNLSKISYFLQINAEFSLTNALEMYINKLEGIENADATVGGIIEDTGSKGANGK